MNDEQDTWTLDDSARASNPGNIEVNLLRWIRHYPKWPIIWTTSLLGSIACAWFVHWSFWIPAVLLLALNWFYWQRVRDHFRHGCANPGIILSLDPTLIAVTTDLTKGFGDFPVVKIIEKSLPSVCGQLPQVGSRVPTVALYVPSPDENLPHWADFDPRPVDCATGDVAAMQAVMDTFTEEEWQELNERLRQVPRPYQCGLYHIEQPE